MSVAKAMKQNEREKKSSRGSTNNKGRLDAFKKRVGSATADWGGCNPAKIQGVVVEITSLGGAVTFGLSRDQGSYSVTVMLDNERATVWFNGDADLDQELDDVVGHIQSMS